MRGLLSVVLAALLLSPSAFAVPSVRGRPGSGALKAATGLAPGGTLVRARDVRSAERTDHESPSAGIAPGRHSLVGPHGSAPALVLEFPFRPFALTTDFASRGPPLFS